MTHENNKEDQCCPKFDPTPWEGRRLEWQDKMFVMDTIPQFFHIPLLGAFGKTVHRMWEKIKKAGAEVDNKDFLMLAYDPSPWKSKLHINVTREVPDIKNVKISGTFLTKVFDGPFKDAKKWYKKTLNYTKEKGMEAKKIYFYYTTCPKCAKKYGHNYVITFAQVK